MEKKIKAVTVRILDKDYMVACPDGEQIALTAAAKRVDREMRKVREMGKVFGTDRIAVMVALNLAYELLYSPQTSAVTPELLTQLEKLQQKLDDSLEQHKA